jgi:hypothetical protein
MRTIEEIERAMRLQKDMTWAHFESTIRGEIPLHFKGFRERILIKMRVGLHMGKPMQALIADDQFIRMRAAPEYADCKLTKLDPLFPDKCLYIDNRVFTSKGHKFWKPYKNWNLSDIVNTTLKNRTGQLAQNLSRNNSLLLRLTKK